jgi:hypothetical protein
VSLSAPFPWFGGKSRAAEQVWAALGDVDSYVEPFGGSIALLLARPDEHRAKVETVNDADGLLVNWWRAVRADPGAVARWVDWPVTETDLIARHLWLIERRGTITARLEADPEWYDTQAAGWWVWGACAWIGSGWCSGKGPWRLVDGQVTRGDGGRGVNRKLPLLGNAGVGVNRKLPHLTTGGQGVNRQLPHLANAGRGVNRLPHLGDAGRGVQLSLLDGRGPVRDWFVELATRLRRVRVACGDWRRVTTSSVVEGHGTAGVVLDPPYPEGWDPDRAYAGQDQTAAEICRDVFAAAAELADRGVRVVVCGYDGTWTPPDGWTARRWLARKGYAKTQDQTRREVLWCSPACLPEPG